MTRPLSPLVLSAPLAAAVLLAATGWATDAGTPATASPTPAIATAERTTTDPALRALRHAVQAERRDIRRLERTLDHARAQLRRARDQADTAATATWSASTPSVAGGSGSSGSGQAPAPPPTDTTTGGS